MFSSKYFTATLLAYIPAFSYLLTNLKQKSSIKDGQGSKYNSQTFKLSLLIRAF